MSKIIRVNFCHWPDCPYHLSISAGRDVKCELSGKTVYALTVEQFREIAVDGKLPCPKDCKLEDAPPERYSSGEFLHCPYCHQGQEPTTQWGTGERYETTCTECGKRFGWVCELVDDFESWTLEDE